MIGADGHGLFTTSMPVRYCANLLKVGTVATNPPNTNNGVILLVVDHPLVRDECPLLDCCLLINDYLVYKDQSLTS